MSGQVTLDQALDLVEVAILEKNGIKGVELAAIPELVLGVRPYNLPDLLEMLVKKHRVVEVSYVLMGSNYRERSFYLPSGSEVRVNKG